MILLLLECLGFSTLHCLDGGEPCGLEPGPENDLQELFETWPCSGMFFDTYICEEHLNRSRDKIRNAVNALVEAGGDLEKPYADGDTILIRVSYLGFVETVRTLIEHGSSINFEGMYGKTALMKSTLNGKVDVVNVLLENDVDVNKEETFINKTALHFALETNHLEIAQKLIKAGANVNHADWRKRTPLHLAAEYGFLEIVKILLERGAEVNLQSSDVIYQEADKTPLMFAAIGGHTDVVKVLLKNGADIGLKDAEGQTAAMSASINNQQKTLDILLEREKSFLRE